MDEIRAIHESLVNGQRKQMVQQINDYQSDYDIWSDYLSYLKELYSVQAQLNYFSDAVISYNRITNK